VACVVGFVALYAVVALRLVDVTVLHPRMPSASQIAGLETELQCWMRRALPGGLPSSTAASSISTAI